MFIKKKGPRHRSDIGQRRRQSLTVIKKIYVLLIYIIISVEVDLHINATHQLPFSRN